MLNALPQEIGVGVLANLLLSPLRADVLVAVPELPYAGVQGAAKGAARFSDRSSLLQVLVARQGVARRCRDIHERRAAAEGGHAVSVSSKATIEAGGPLMLVRIFTLGVTGKIRKHLAARRHHEQTCR